jgi:hypothetical protein
VTDRSEEGKREGKKNHSDIKERKRIKMYLFVYSFIFLLTFTLYKDAMANSAYVESKLRKTNSDLERS